MLPRRLRIIAWSRMASSPETPTAGPTTAGAPRRRARTATFALIVMGLALATVAVAASLAAAIGAWAPELRIVILAALVLFVVAGVILTLTRSITRDKHSLQQQRDFLDQILEHAGAAVLISESDGEARANAALLDILGHPLAETAPLGQRLSALAPEDRERFIGLFSSTNPD